MRSDGFAARAARWSASHRKTAIWGWLAIVVVLIGVGESVPRERRSRASTASPVSPSRPSAP